MSLNPDEYRALCEQVSCSPLFFPLVERFLLHNTLVRDASPDGTLNGLSDDAFDAIATGVFESPDNGRAMAEAILASYSEEARAEMLQWSIKSVGLYVERAILVLATTAESTCVDAAELLNPDAVMVAVAALISDNAASFPEVLRKEWDAHGLHV